MKTESHLIIIVGGNHHNGLNLARSLGKNGFLIDCCVITDANESILQYSKYTRKCGCFQNEKDAFDWILNHYIDQAEKPVLIPYSDGAAMELDNRLKQFADRFYVPSIGGHEGKITFLMNKKNQYDWATQNGIKMASSIECELRQDILQPFEYPIILKPALSAEGDKGDICICENESEFKKEVVSLIEKGYSRTIIQPYLSIDYEIDVFGCIRRNNPRIMLVPTETIRAWPLKKGTNCFSKIIIDEERIDKCKFIINKLKDCGFYGLYDIEILVVNGEFFLNEINYRNSGDDYMALSQNYYYAVAWVNDVLGICEETQALEHPLKATYAMTFNCDIRHVFSHRLGLLKWCKDCLRTKDFALKYPGDMRPMWFFYMNKIIKKLRGLCFERK